MEPRTESQPWGITIIATLMILFGVAEVFTGLLLGGRACLSRSDRCLPVRRACRCGRGYRDRHRSLLRPLHRIEVTVPKVSDRGRLRAGGIDSRLKFRAWIAGSRSRAVRHR